MLSGYSSEKSIRQTSTHRDYLSTLRQKYTENNNPSMAYKAKIDILSDNNGSYRKRSPQVTRDKRNPLQQNRQFLNRQSGSSNRLQLQYQSLINKKTGISERANTFLTDRVHLKLRELKKLSVVQTYQDKKALLSSDLAINKVNGSVQDKSKQNCQQFLSINPDIYDSPIKFLYSDESKPFQKENIISTVKQKQEETLQIQRSKSLLRNNEIIIKNNPRMYTNKIQRQSNQSVISNVQKLLGQIRKTLNS